MPTPFSLCYDVFLDNIDDIDILFAYDEETEEEYQSRISEMLLSMLRSAVRKFTHPQTDLERDDYNELFVNDLKEIEIEIIGLLMLREYYRKKFNFLVQLKMSYRDKDWQSHSKSEQMSQYRQLLKEINQDIKVLIADSSYIDNRGRLENWIDDDE